MPNRQFVLPITSTPGGSSPILVTPGIFVPGAGADMSLALASPSNASLPLNKGISFWIFHTPFLLFIKQLTWAFATTAPPQHAWVGIYTCPSNPLADKVLIKSTGSIALPGSGLTLIPFVQTLQPGSYFLIVTSDDIAGNTIANHLQIGSTADLWDDYNVGGHANPGIGTSTAPLVAGDLPPTIPIASVSAGDILMPLVVFGV